MREHPAPHVSPSTSDWVDQVEQIIDRHKSRPGALLPILHDIQEELRHIPPDAIPVIAKGLNLSRAEVFGVVSFYHDFTEAPRGQYRVQLCRAESCQAVGAEALARHACARLRVEFHGTTDDGAITLEPVYCLGNCALSPAMMINGELHGRVTPERFDAITSELRSVS